MFDDSLDTVNPDEQRHHSANRLIRVQYDHLLKDRPSSDLEKQLVEIGVAFGLPYDLPPPPAGLPGVWSRKVDMEVLGIIREGARYLLALADGEKRTLWNIHDEIREKLRDAYEKGRSDEYDRHLDERIKVAQANDREKAQKERNAVVYFIQTDAGEIKIGKAIDADARLRGLQTSHPAKLTLLATSPGGAKQERKYHKQFAAHRLEGEWFEPHEDILAEIARLQEDKA